MTQKNMYPFTAIVGQEQAKLGLVLALINPKLGGGILYGENGSGKSLLMQSLLNLVTASPVFVPLGATEDQLDDVLDFEAVLSGGKLSLESGLLRRAHGRVMCIENINRMMPQVLIRIAETLENGGFYTEEDGVSMVHASEFVLFGTMIPDSGALRPHLYDRLGLKIPVKTSLNLEDRIEILKRAMAYALDPADFCKQYARNEARLQARIELAKKEMAHVIVSDACVAQAVKISKEHGASGHRSDIRLVQAARAHAAWRGDRQVSLNDIECVKAFIFEWGQAEAPDSAHMQGDTESSPSLEQHEKSPLESKHDGSTRAAASDPTIIEDENASEKTPDAKQKNSEKRSSEGVHGIELHLPAANARGGKSGRRGEIQSDAQTGRYVKSIPTWHRGQSIAIDATIRRAVMHAFERKENSRKIVIRREDFCAKIRAHKVRSTILFLVDASGSMRAMRRIEAVKETVLFMLSEAYEKRDLVGLVAFKGNQAETVLDITRSHALARKRLLTLKTGGKTPLALGLEKASKLLASQRIRETETLQYLVIISDGKGNVPLYSNHAYEDALKVAAQIRQQPIEVVFLDCDTKRFDFGFSRMLSEALAAHYIRLNEVTGREVLSHLNQVIR